MTRTELVIQIAARPSVCELRQRRFDTRERARCVCQIRNCVMTHSPTRDSISITMTPFVAAALIAVVMNAPRYAR
jgi:hypothetical protein